MGSNPISILINSYVNLDNWFNIVSLKLRNEILTLSIKLGNIIRFSLLFPIYNHKLVSPAFGTHLLLLYKTQTEKKWTVVSWAGSWKCPFTWHCVSGIINLKENIET